MPATETLRRARVAVPIVTLVVVVGTLLSCVIIAKTKNVYLSGLFWPFFSWTGRDAPAYYVFCVGLTLTALLMIPTWTFNHQYQRAVLTAAMTNTGVDVSKHLRMIQITRFAGVISVIGLPVLAIFDTARHSLIHQLGAYWFFAWEVLATIINTVVSKRIHAIAKTSVASAYVVLEAGSPVAAADKSNAADKGARRTLRTLRIQRVINVIFFIAFFIYIPLHLMWPATCPALTVDGCLERNLGVKYCTVTMRKNEFETKLSNCENNVTRVQIRALSQLTCVLSLIAYCVTFVAHDYEVVDQLQQQAQHKDDIVEVSPVAVQEAC